MSRNLETNESAGFSKEDCCLLNRLLAPVRWPGMNLNCTKWIWILRGRENLMKGVSAAADGGNSIWCLWTTSYWIMLQFKCGVKVQIPRKSWITKRFHRSVVLVSHFLENQIYQNYKWGKIEQKTWRFISVLDFTIRLLLAVFGIKETFCGTAEKFCPKLLASCKKIDQIHTLS